MHTDLKIYIGKKFDLYVIHKYFQSLLCKLCGFVAMLAMVCFNIINWWPNQIHFDIFSMLTCNLNVILNNWAICNNL